MKQDMYEIIADLEEAAEYSDDELGEWWRGLVNLWPRVVNGGSNEFLLAYEKEVREEHKRLKEEFELVEETVTREVTYKELVMKGER